MEDGSKHEGLLCNKKQHGPEVYTNKFGEEITGIWKEGELISERWSGEDKRIFQLQAEFSIERFLMPENLPDYLIIFPV
jgi:hypothetical protein